MRQASAEAGGAQGPGATARAPLQGVATLGVGLGGLLGQLLGGGKK
ncbi:hypothetical protein [Streptomyces sp. NPDC054838]